MNTYVHITTPSPPLEKKSREACHLHQCWNMSSYIPYDIECWGFRCLYGFHYVLSHCFETIRISNKSQQIKIILFQFYKERKI